MKKLLAIAITAICMVTSTFALGFEIGGRGFLGTNFADDATFKDVGDQLKKITFESEFDYGFGAYANISILGGLGVQGELNLVKGKTKLSEAINGGAKDFETWTIDVPLMVWINQDIGSFAFGLGAGPNFSVHIPTGTFKECYENVITSFKDNMFNIGAIFGIDLKFYFNDHFGLNLGARYITDFSSTKIPLLADKGDADYKRKSLYANLGLQFRLF